MYGESKNEPQHHASLPHTVHPNSPSPGCLLPYFFPLIFEWEDGPTRDCPIIVTSTVGPSKCVEQLRTSTMLELAPALTCFV